MTEPLTFEEHLYLAENTTNLQEKINLLTSSLSVWTVNNGIEKLSEVYYKIGLTAFQKGWYEDSQESLWRALEQNTENQESRDLIQVIKNIFDLYQKAMEHEVNHYFLKAKETYFQILDLNSGDFNAYYNLGNNAIARYENDEAIEHYSKCIEMQDDFETVYYNRAWLYEKMKNIDAAIQDYIHVTNLNPENVKAWFNLGHIYFELGETIKALHCYQRAAELGEDEAILIINEINNTQLGKNQ